MVYTAEQAFEFLKNNPNISVSEKVDQRLENDAAEKPKKPCISVSTPTRSAASRVGMAGWAGEGGGRFGERREYEAPTLPSTPRQHGSARHQTRQPRNSSPPHKPAEKQLATTQASRETERHHTCQPSQCSLKTRACSKWEFLASAGSTRNVGHIMRFSAMRDRWRTQEPA